jgi:YVTN family beta-propeller protein
VSVIDPATDKVIKTIAVGVGPRHTFFSPDGLEAYVTNEFDDTLSLIDTAAMAAVATVKVGVMPHFHMVVGDRIFVTDFGGRAVSVVRRATRQVERTIRVGAGPLGPGATRDGSRVYVACHNANTVAVIDTKDPTVIAEIPTEPGPVQVTVTPDQKFAYVTGDGRGTVQRSTWQPTRS